MKFNQEPLHHGAKGKVQYNPSYWLSEDNQYSISKYRYKSIQGRPATACTPYFAGYHRPSGNRLTKDMPSFAECVSAIESYLQKSN